MIFYTKQKELELRERLRTQERNSVSGYDEVASTRITVSLKTNIKAR